MAGVTHTIAEVMILPSLIAVVAGYVLMVQALCRVVPEENRYARLPWASRTTIYLFLVGGFSDAIRAATGDEHKEWQRALLGRALVFVGAAALLGSLLMWKLKDGT